MKLKTSNRLSCLSFIATVAAMVPTAQAGPLDNGDFESGLSPWVTEGTVTIEDAGANGSAAVLHEADSRGLSRIYPGGKGGQATLL